MACVEYCTYSYFDVNGVQGQKIIFLAYYELDRTCIYLYCVILGIDTPAATAGGWLKQCFYL